MSVVLDTHAWIWFLNKDRRLGQGARAAIEAALTGPGAVLSAITPWEIAMLAAKDRITLARDVLDWLEHHISLPGFALHPLSVAISVDSNRLPPTCHGDPADRIVIATARHLDAPVVTADRKILAYAAAGHVQALDAAA